MADRRHQTPPARWRAVSLSLLASALLAGLLSWSAPAGAQTPATPKRVTGFDLAGDNSNPWGVWGNDETIWVANNGTGSNAVDKIFAYERSDGSRDSGKDFNTLDAAGNGSPTGLCSDGTTMFVADDGDEKVYAYNMSDTTRDSTKDITLDSANGDAKGIWCNSTHLWASQDEDSLSSKVFAYQRSDGSHVSAMDFAASTLSPSTSDGTINNSDPRGLWSDGTTMFVIDDEDEQVYAYQVSDRTRDAAKHAALDGDNSQATGLWFDGRVLWVADRGDDSLYVYDLPGAQPNNTPAAGGPAVGAFPRVGIELTADIDGITDATDMLANAVFHYQWVRVDGTDETDLDGQTGSTYTPTGDDLGKHLQVRVVFDDDAGNKEYPRTSPQVGPVADPAVTVAFAPGTFNTVVEGSTLSVKVQLSAEPGREVVVPLAATNEGGASDSDYSVPASVTFQSGDTEKSFDFSAVDDTVDDDDEWVRLGFGTLPADVTTEGPFDETAVFILDDDDPEVTVAFEQDTRSVAEGGTVSVKVTLSADPERTVAIPITATNEDGASGSDYSGVPANVTFNATETEKSFTFRAVDDTVDDDGESVRLGFGTLPARVEAGATSEATVSIGDDDDPEVTVSFGTGSYPVGEGSTVTVKVTLSADPERTVTIPITRSNQGGASNSDHSGVPASVTFNATETEKSFTFRAVDDTVDDDGESVRLRFGALPARVAAGATTEATVSITDDDANTAATGAPTIVGTARVGEKLIANTSGIADVDGLGTSFAYQWVRVDGMTDTNVGTDSPTYTVVEADLGKQIRVDLTFDDAADSAEGPLSSAPTGAVVAAVAAPNTDATGVPTISGPERVDGVIRANTSAIGDSNSITNVSFLYQWQVTEGESGLPATRFVDIAGATGSSTHTLTAAQQDLMVRVVVSFIDDAGHLESATSEAVGPIAGNATGVPTISGPEQVEGVLTAGISAIRDPDGIDSASLEYQWQVNVGSADSTIFIDIADATESTHTLTGGEQDRRVRVVVTFDDDDGNAESVTSAVTDVIVARPTGPATGEPAISGTRQAGEVLTASPGTIDDIDGIDNASADNNSGFGYQWIRVDGGSEADIPGAVRSTYELTDDDVGKMIRVKVTFSDDHFNPEERTSSEVGPIAAGSPNTAVVEARPRVVVATVPATDPPALTVAEGGSGSYTLVLAAAPSADVTIDITVTAGGEVTVDPASVTFSTTNWANAQPVTVDADQDADTNNDRVTITHAVTSTDTDYSAVTVANVAVTVTDDDPGGGSTGGGSTGGGGSFGGGGGGGGGAPEPEPETPTDYFIDDDGSTHEANINKIAAAEITVGCNPPESNRYCPLKSVTRAQMASFLARALDLPDTDTDYFVDDDGSTHEANINKIAAAGITVGCNPPDSDRFCGGLAVTRAQMASFLARALDLPDTDTDYFVDDDGSTHEANINKIAAAGITVGCNPPDSDRYCLTQPVTRAHMASFLARALDL